MADQSHPAVARDQACDGVLPLSGDGLRVTASPLAARFVLRGAMSLPAWFGPSLPLRLGTATAEGRAALWLGPDETLLLAPGGDAGALFADLERDLAAQSCSLVDVSHRQAGLVVEGPLSSLCLAAGCPLDLRPSAFPVGMVARTIFFKCEIILWRRAQDCFHVEVWRSFVPYLAGQLAQARAGTAGLPVTGGGAPAPMHW